MGPHGAGADVANFSRLDDVVEGLHCFFDRCVRARSGEFGGDRWNPDSGASNYTTSQLSALGIFIQKRTHLASTELKMCFRLNPDAFM